MHLALGWRWLCLSSMQHVMHPAVDGDYCTIHSGCYGRCCCTVRAAVAVVAAAADSAAAAAAAVVLWLQM